MWKLLQRLFAPKLVEIHVFKTVNFTRPTERHWARYEYGDQYDAHFTIRGQVQRGDNILVLCRSGRIGCYTIFSCRRDFSGFGDYYVHACAVGYFNTSKPKTDKVIHALPPKIKGLLTAGSSCQ